ncbi:MAG: hypothetical protein AAF990_11480 [Bacteroidota bacterium]
MSNLINNAPYTYLCQDAQEVFHLFVCIPHQSDQLVSQAVVFNAGGITRVEYTTSSHFGNADYFFDHQIITPNTNAAQNSVEVLVYDNNANDYHKSTLLLDDSDLNLEDNLHQMNVAHNCPYVHLSNPQDDPFNNLFYPHLIIPLFGYTLEQEQATFPNGANGIFTGNLSLQPSNAAAIVEEILPATINSSHYMDHLDIDGHFVVTTLLKGGGGGNDDKAKHGTVRNLGADTKPSPFVNFDPSRFSTAEKMEKVNI